MIVKNKITIIGGGLAGVESAYQLAKRGFDVELYEMRPVVNTPIHKTSNLAELVCSNSLKSKDVNTSQGLLKWELEQFDSLVLRCAYKTCVPSGGALSVDREKFSKEIEAELEKFANIKIVREELTEINEYTIVASGPLTSDRLAKKINELFGDKNLQFYDAVAPIITKESVDMSKAFYAGRYGKGGDDYLNCGMDKEEYYSFVKELQTAERVITKEFEKKDIFSACMPVEVMASKGEDSLRFGPLKPVGLYDPKTNIRPYAVVQLRKEDNYDLLYNLVGFQTNLKFAEQKRVFSMIPALKNADFVRYGVMHRNTYINAPVVLNADFSLKANKKIFFAGQITGVEGYLESVLSGLLAGVNMARVIEDKETILPPKNTMSGSLMRYISSSNSNFQPMHVSYSLVEELGYRVKEKAKRKEEYSLRAKREMTEFLDNLEGKEI